MTQTTDTLIERLEALLSAGNGYPWAYRPKQYDDWGFIRCAPDAEGREWIAAISHGGGRDDNLDEHRRNRTDPYEPHGRLIVEAVNALPTLLSALRSTAKEVDRLRIQMERIGWHDLTATEARDIARAALTPADPGKEKG